MANYTVSYNDTFDISLIIFKNYLIDVATQYITADDKFVQIYSPDKKYLHLYHKLPTDLSNDELVEYFLIKSRENVRRFIVNEGEILDQQNVDYLESLIMNMILNTMDITHYLLDSRAMKQEECKEELDGIIEILKAKNHDYGSSTHDTVELFGMVPSYGVRIVDKLNRAKSLSFGKDPRVNESLQDTLIDLVGYLLLFLVEIEYQSKFAKNK